MTNADNLILSLWNECLDRFQGERCRIDDHVPAQDLLEIADALLDEGRVGQSDLFRAFARVRVGRLLVDAKYARMVVYYPTQSVVVAVAKRFFPGRRVVLWRVEIYGDYQSSIRIILDKSPTAFVSAVDALNAYADEVANNDHS